MYTSITAARWIASVLPAAEAGLFALAIHLDHGVRAQLGLRGFCLAWAILHADWPAVTATVIDCSLDAVKLSRVVLAAARLAWCTPNG